MTTKAEALARFDAIVEAGLARQAARPPREAAIASLGPRATEEQITAWLALYRPDALPTARSAS